MIHAQIASRTLKNKALQIISKRVSKSKHGAGKQNPLKENIANLTMHAQRSRIRENSMKHITEIWCYNQGTIY